MKNKIKLIGVIAIILSMALSLIPNKAFAAYKDGDISIEVKGAVSERTLSAYKLFTIDDKDGDNIYYSWSDDVKAFFSSYDSNLTTVAKATDFMKGKSASELNDIAEAYYKYAQDNSISHDATVTGAKGAESVTLKVTGSGYYIIFDETNLTATGKKAQSVAMLNNVVEDMTGDKAINIKVDEISKPEKESNAVTADVGQIVTFTVTSTVPTMAGYDAYNYDFIDTLSKGLTFYEDDKNPTTVVIGNTTLDLNGTTDGTDVTYTKNSVVNANSTTTLTISLKDLIKMKGENNVGSVGDAITVTYHAKVNKDAVTEEVGGHTKNEVKVKYSNDPYNDESFEETPPDVVHIYTYTVNFTKKNSSDESLAGAKFVVKSGDKFVSYNDDKEVVLVDSQADAEVFTSDENGAFSVPGLKAGTYSLVETETPKDYALPNFEFEFEIAQTLNDDGTLKNATYTYTADKNVKVSQDMMTNNISQNSTETDTKAETATTFAVDVINVKEGALPTTGGIGTKIFTIAGLIIMISAAGIIIYRNKSNK